MILIILCIKVTMNVTQMYLSIKQLEFEVFSSHLILGLAGSKVVFLSEMGVSGTDHVAGSDTEL